LQSFFVLFVTFLDNHGIAIDADPLWVDPERVDFVLQYFEVNQSSSGNQQPRLGSDVARRELPEKNRLTHIIHKRVAGIRPSTTNTDVDFLLSSYDCSDLAFAFAAVLAAHHYPKTHD
jgi:hypothetical protein